MERKAITVFSSLRWMRFPWHHRYFLLPFRVIFFFLSILLFLLRRAFDWNRRIPLLLTFVISDSRRVFFHCFLPIFLFLFCMIHQTFVRVQVAACLLPNIWNLCIWFVNWFQSLYFGNGIEKRFFCVCVLLFSLLSHEWKMSKVDFSSQYQCRWV